MGDEDNGEKPSEGAPPWKFDEASFAGFGAWVTEALRARDRFTDQKTFREFLGSAFVAFERSVPAASFGKGWKPSGDAKKKPEGGATAPVPLTREEIAEAIGHSGYPLEIRLLDRFHEAGLDPDIGQRFFMGPGESAEVDLMARVMVPLSDNAGHVMIYALIEAKQFGERNVFAGFRWRTPSAHEMRVVRGRFVGRPHDEDGAMHQLVFGSSQIGGTLDELNRLPLCPHWALVRDSAKKGFIEASKEEHHRASFGRLLRVCTWLEHDHSSFLQSAPGDSLHIELMLPTIILGEPAHLHTYDAVTKAVEPVDQLTLSERFELHGKNFHRYVDVVTERAVPKLIERMKRLGRVLANDCDRHLDDLRRIRDEQSKPDFVRRMERIRESGVLDE